MYWDMKGNVDALSVRRESGASLSDSLRLVEEALNESVRLRMDTDVPFGAFLSGGIDSTCIAALMQNNSSKKISTFSIGFKDKQYNEAQHAAAVAKVLGTEHHELYLEEKDMVDFVPKLHEIYDEPFSDSSQLPTFLLSKLVKKKITV